MIELFVAAFVTFFVIIDAPGVTPIFAGLTEGTSGAHKRAMAIKSVIISSFVLVGFAIGGEWLFDQLHVSLDAFRIAGGVLLFLMALEMLFEKRTERREHRAEALMDETTHAPPTDISVFPIAVPMVAGPGAITSVMLFMKEAESMSERVAVFAAVGANLVLCLIFFLGAGIMMRLLGDTIASVITRLLGVVLAALSTQFIVDGVSAAFLTAVSASGAA